MDKSVSNDQLASFQAAYENDPGRILATHALSRSALGDVAFVSAKQGRLDRLDVGLFKRASGEYVLHRVLSVTEDGYLFCGDSQGFTETVDEGRVLGVLTGLVRRGRQVDLSGWAYRGYVALWCRPFGMRRALLRVLHRMGIWVPGK